MSQLHGQEEQPNNQSINQSLIDYIAVNNRMKENMLGVKGVSGMFYGSDHFVLVPEVRTREKWELKGNEKKENEGIGKWKLA